MIKFNEELHKYTVDGRSYPSVTTILGAVGVVYFFDTSTSETAMTRGSYVHEAIKLWTENNLDEDILDEMIKPYFQAYQKFVKETGFVVEMSEFVSCNRSLVYAGTLDAVGILNNSKVLIDFKTGGIGELAVRLQTAAYMKMEGVTGISARYGLQLMADGNYKLTKPYTEHSKDFNSFVACKHVYDLQKARIKNGKVERV